MESYNLIPLEGLGGEVRALNSSGLLLLRRFLHLARGTMSECRADWRNPPCWEEGNVSRLETPLVHRPPWRLPRVAPQSEGLIPQGTMPDYRLFELLTLNFGFFLGVETLYAHEASIASPDQGIIVPWDPQP